MVGRALHVFQQIETGRCLINQLTCVCLVGEVVIMVNSYNDCHLLQPLRQKLDFWGLIIDMITLQIQQSSIC